MKVKGKKTKRWPKHGSSSTCPNAVRFREASRTGSLKRSLGPSGLTVEALQIHDGDSSDAASSSLLQQPFDNWDAKTYRTFATNLTGCTNVTFSSVLQTKSNSALNKEVLAQLASATQEIRNKGGSGFDYEYFLKLLEYLENAEKMASDYVSVVSAATTSATSKEGKESETVPTATAKLLSLVIKKMPDAALQSKFSDISKRLVEALNKYYSSSSVALITYLLMCLAHVVRVQTMPVWKEAKTLDIFRSLLDFTLDKRPKVKQAAHRAVKIVLKGSTYGTKPHTCHKAAQPTADFCLYTLEKNAKSGIKLGSPEEMDTLHVLKLLEDVMITFPHKHILEACSKILGVMNLPNPKVKRGSLEAIFGLFSQRPAADVLTPKENGQIINALYEQKPEENDSFTMPAWLIVMEQAHLNLSRHDMRLCLEHLPRLFSVTMRSLMSQHSVIRNVGKHSLNLLLKSALGLETESLVGLLAGPQASWLRPQLEATVGALEGGLSYQYNHNWNLVFEVFTTMMEVLGKICPDLLSKFLGGVVDLRESPSCTFKAEADLVVGKAVRVMGPQLVLQAIPLNISTAHDVPDLSRSWLLPVLRDNICDTELSFFAQCFLKLAQDFKNKAESLHSQNKMVLARTYDTLEMQVWSLLKGFCTRPTDLPQAFPEMARHLGSALKERADLRFDIMAALRTLVNFSKNDEKDKATMARFAKNYVPILLNQFTDTASEAEGHHHKERLAVLETIKVYLTIAPLEYQSDVLEKFFAKLTADDNSPVKMIALLDVAIVMVGIASNSYLKKLFEIAESKIKALSVKPVEKSAQKKAYRMVEEICSCQSEACAAFVSSHITQLQQLLTDSSTLEAAASQTLAPRLRCLVCICRQLKEPNKEFIKVVTPQAVHCTKGVSVKSRATAYTLVVELAEAMIRWNPDSSEQDVLNEYANMLMAGFSGSVETICCSLLAFTRLIFHYKERLAGGTLTNMVKVACQLLLHARREVVRSALDFVKTLCGAFKQDVLTTHLADLVMAIKSIKANCYSHVKMVLKKLIKKFGHKDILEMAPELSQVIKKANAELKQEQKKKEKKDKEEDSSEEEETAVRVKPETVEEVLEEEALLEEDEEEEGKKGREKVRVKKGRQHQAFIREGEEDITDLMDTSAAKKVVANKPKVAAQKAEKKDDFHGFKVAPDGRFIITAGPEEGEKGERMDSSDEEDLDDLLATIEGGSEKKRRKRLRDEEKFKDSDDDEPSTKYKAGGRGIHRPIKQKPAPGAEYKAKKAGGDMKKPGKHDPYSYVSLSMASLNKRKRAKLHGQLAGLVRGAKKGALKASRKKGKKR